MRQVEIGLDGFKIVKVIRSDNPYVGLVIKTR